MTALLGILALILLYLARNKYIDPDGFTPAEEKISNWVSTIGFLVAIFSLGVSYLVSSGPTGNGFWFHKLGIVIRILLGSAGLGYGLTLAERGAPRNLVHNVLLWAGTILVPPLVQIMV